LPIEKLKLKPDRSYQPSDEQPMQTLLRRPIEYEGARVVCVAYPTRYCAVWYSKGWPPAIT
jgi:hypothetical protein